MDLSYTFLCLRPDGVEAHLDLLVAESEAQVRVHAKKLLSEHRSCDRIEVWRDAVCVLMLSREVTA